MDRSNHLPARHPQRFTAGACLSLALLFPLAACNSNHAPAVTDAGLTSSIQAQLAADNSIAGQPIQTQVQNGAVTLSGTVSNDAQRTIAARDAAAIAGVRQVINNLSVVNPPVANPPVANLPVTTVPPSSATVFPSPERAPAPRPRVPATTAPTPAESRAKKPQPTVVAPITRADAAGSANAANQAPSQPAPRAAAPKPTFRSVTIPAGNTVSVRVTQTLDSASTQQGATFSGALASDVISDGLVAIPAGAGVTGRVDAVQEAAHFKGASLLTVSLTGITRRGERIPVTSEPYTVEGKGRGKNTAIKAGGGAAVGAVLGGIFGGGKGAAIGAATGGGLGAGSNAITRGQQVQITSESVVRFRLAQPITLQVRSDAAGGQQDRTSDNPSTPNDNPSDGGPPILQRRPNNPNPPQS